MGVWCDQMSPSTLEHFLPLFQRVKICPITRDPLNVTSCPPLWRADAEPKGKVTSETGVVALLELAMNVNCPVHAHVGRKGITTQDL